MVPVTLKRMTALGHTVFTEGDYNLNIVGIRAETAEAGKFDDLLQVIYRVDGTWHTRAWNATLDPGLTYLNEPLNPHGAAILCPQQVRGLWTVGKHKGRDGLVQRKDATFWRDNNKDNRLDRTGRRYFDIVGLNLHDPGWAGRPGADIGRSGAGCVVLERRDHYVLEFWPLILRAAAIWGPHFTGTILDEW